MKNLFIVLTFLFVTSKTFSQINELGLSIGGSNYIGDIGSTKYINPNQLAAGLVYKWNYSPRTVYRLDATYIKIAADDANANNSERERRGYSFKNSVKELAFGIEYNYFDYSMIYKEHASTPYIILQVAINNYNVAVNQNGSGATSTFETENKTSFTVPFGLGYKTRLGPKIGIAFETKIRYTFADDLDFNNYDIPDLSFGSKENDDWYITTGITIVFGFGRKGCYSGGF